MFASISRILILYYLKCKEGYAPIKFINGNRYVLSKQTAAINPN